MHLRIELTNSTYFQNFIVFFKKKAYLCARFQKKDSVAQLVEHIPFKDGVLGSSPS